MVNHHTVSIEVITKCNCEEIFSHVAIVVQAVSGEEVVKMAEKKARPLPLENMATTGAPSAALVEALKSFCKSVVGTGVIALSEVKDKLLLRQTTASDQDPLRLTL